MHSHTHSSPSHIPGLLLRSPLPFKNDKHVALASGGEYALEAFLTTPPQLQPDLLTIALLYSMRDMDTLHHHIFSCETPSPLKDIDHATHTFGFIDTHLIHRRPAWTAGPPRRERL